IARAIGKPTTQNATVRKNANVTSQTCGGTMLLGSNAGDAGAVVAIWPGSCAILGASCAAFLASCAATFACLTMSRTCCLISLDVAAGGGLTSIDGMGGALAAPP